MAAPESCTTLDLSGKFVMNKDLSDSSDRILQLQGVGWIKRKAIEFATVTLNVKHYKDDDSIEHIDIDQVITANFPGTSENRTLDWIDRHKEDGLFGFVVSKTRRLAVAEIDDAHLRGEWLADTLRDGAIHSIARSDTEKSHLVWTAEQVWGFESIKEERRYTRRVKFDFKDGDEVHEIRLVYDRL